MKARVPLRVVGLIVVGIAAFTHAWLLNTPRELGAGLFGFRTGNEIWSNIGLIEGASDPNHVSTLWVVLGQLTFALGLGAGVLQLVAGFKPRLRIYALVASVLAAAAGTAFVFLGPTGPAFGLSIGWSYWLFLVGIMAGVTAALA